MWEFQFRRLLLDDNGQPKEGNGGTFTIDSSGHYTFDPGTAFDDLEVGETRTSMIGYDVTLTSLSGGGSYTTTGCYLIVTVTQETKNKKVESFNAYFPDFGVRSLGLSDNLYPDLAAYVQDLKNDAEAGGAGNSISVSQYG